MRQCRQSSADSGNAPLTNLASRISPESDEAHRKAPSIFFFPFCRKRPLYESISLRPPREDVSPSISDPITLSGCRRSRPLSAGRSAPGAHGEGGAPTRDIGLEWLTGEAFNHAFLTILVGAGVPHQLAQLVSIGLIALLMFQLMRRVVFANPPSDRPAR